MNFEQNAKTFNSTIIYCLSAHRKNRGIFSNEKESSKRGITRYKYPILGYILKTPKRTRHKCTPRRKMKRSGCRRRRTKRRSGCGSRRRRRRRRSARKCGRSRRRKSRRSSRGCKKRRGGKKRKVKCMREGPITNNGYLNFLRCYRKTHCGLKPIEAVKRGAKVWCSLSPERRLKYNKMACRVSTSKRRQATKFCRSVLKKTKRKC